MTKKKESTATSHELTLGTNVDLPGLLEFAYEQGIFDVVPSQAGTNRAHSLQATKGQTQIQLDMLLEQMKLIAAQAQEIKERVALSQRIYETQMTFDPDVGGIYYLYLKKSGETFLSLISPQEWKTGHTWLAKVELAADHTWKVLDSSAEFASWARL